MPGRACFQAFEEKVDVRALALQTDFQAAGGITNIALQSLLSSLSKEEGPHAHTLHFAFDKDEFPVWSSHLTPVNEVKQSLPTM